MGKNCLSISSEYEECIVERTEIFFARFLKVVDSRARVFKITHFSLLLITLFVSYFSDFSLIDINNFKVVAKLNDCLCLREEIKREDLL